jgi:cell wall-associated NlpC family hydrolase
MTYVDGLQGVLSQISQIQDAFSALPQPGAPGDFESVLANISALSGVPGSSQVISAAAATAEGWPLEEGMPISQSTANSPVDGELASANTEQQSVEAGTSDDATATSDNTLGQEVVADARRYVGVPYQWGGTNPAQGLDCSGLVKDVFAEVGISLPRTSQEQAQVGAPVSSLAAAQPGDLVFFPGTDGTAAAPGHVGIYIGNGEMIDAPYSGASVRIDPVGDPTEIRRATGLATSAPKQSAPPPRTPLRSRAPLRAAVSRSHCS